MSVYYAQIQFVKGQKMLIENIESDSATGRELTLFACEQRMRDKGWTPLFVSRTMERPIEHVVDKAGVDALVMEGMN